MNTKRVATQNAKMFTAVSQTRIYCNLLILVSSLLLVIACTKSEDLEIIGDEFPVENESPIDSSPLIANAGANQTIILPTNFVNLDGSASSDLKNAIVSYSWSKLLGPDEYSFTNANAAQTQVTNLVEGVYQFQLTITNTLDDSAKGVVSVSVIQNSTAIYGSSSIINLMLPIDWVVLNNTPSGSSSNVTGMSWKKLSGPGSYNVSYSNSAYTVLYNLVEGHHQYELTANYLNGSVSKDTVNVNLYDVSIIPQNAKELIIENVSWTFPWYATLPITDFYGLIPRESLFRIFVRRDGSSNWVDVPGWSMSSTQNTLYDYFIERRLPDGAGMYTNGSLYISYFGSDTLDTPDIKIVYW